MSKTPRKRSFADIVRDVKAAPPAPALQYDHPGEYTDGTFVDQEGRRYKEVSPSVSAARAYDVAAQGAVLVWDKGGCGDHCPHCPGYEWFDEADVARMVAAGRPDIRDKRNSKGNISEWLADDGSRLLIAWVDVRWGDVLA